MKRPGPCSLGRPSILQIVVGILKPRLGNLDLPRAGGGGGVRRGDPWGSYLQHPVRQHLPHVRLDLLLHALEVGGSWHVALLQAEQTLQDTLVPQQLRVGPGPGRVPGALATQQLHPSTVRGREQECGLASPWRGDAREGERGVRAGLALALELALCGEAPARPPPAHTASLTGAPPLATM